MIALEHIASLKEFLQTAQTAAVILGPKPTADQAAVAAALTLGLTRIGKEAGVYAPRKLEHFSYSGLKHLQTELGKQNLVVQFDYNESAVDKVSYHIGDDNTKFYLTIKPKKGTKPLDSSSVKFTYAGADADVVFLVGVHDLETLSQLYTGYESLYQNAFVVTLHTFKPEIGTVQLDLSGRSSMSESVADLMEGIGMPLDAEIATDLLAGIEFMTRNLQSLTASAETFETVAKLLHAGGRRSQRSVQPVPSTRPAEEKKVVEIQPKKSDKPRKKPTSSKRHKTSTRSGRNGT